MVEDHDPFVRLWTARALHCINLDPDLPLRTNMGGLKDEDPKVRTMAAYNLDLMGLDAQPALDELRRVAVSDPSEDVRSQARQAVQSVSQ